VVRGKNNIPRILQDAATVLTSALAEIEDSLGQRLLSEEWTWNRQIISAIPNRKD
jgi:hypothetical protein